MAVDWTGYKLAPDFTGLAQGIAAYGQNKQQQAQFEQELALKKQELEMQRAKLGAGNLFARKGQLTGITVIDEAGNVFNQTANYDPNTDQWATGYQPVQPGTTPSGKLDIYSKAGLTASTDIENEAERARRVKQAEQDVLVKTAPEIAGKTEAAKQTEIVKSQYAKSMEQLKADVQKESQMALESGRMSIAQTEPFLDVAKNALDARDENGELIGIYGGTLWGNIAKGELPKVGININQPKLDNTARVRMALTNIKVGAKPAGSGNPTPSEWDMFALTMPDPETANPKQLRSMITALEDIRNRQLKVYQKQSINAPLAPQGAQPPTNKAAADYEAKMKALGL